MSSLPSLQEITAIRDHLKTLSARREQALLVVETAENRVVEADRRKAAIDAGQIVFREAAQQIQDRVQQAFTTVGTQAMASVFRDPYELLLKFSTRAGKSNADVVFVRDGEEYDPLSSVGGGVVDVAAFALRLSALRLTIPPARQLLVLDEPFRFVSQQYRLKVAELLRRLVADHGVQLIMVTHHAELMSVGEWVDIEELQG